MQTHLTVGLGALLILSAAHAAPPPAAPPTCPVMHSAIRNPARAPRLLVNGQPVLFCCAGCPDMVKKNPAKYLREPLKDPVSKKPFTVTAQTPRREHRGGLYLFASASTESVFLKNPDHYAGAPAR